MTQHSVADAVIVAAGSSRRMGGADKLGMTIGGRPILQRTTEALAAAPEVDRLIVVTAAERVEDCLLYTSDAADDL